MRGGLLACGAIGLLLTTGRATAAPRAEGKLPSLYVMGVTGGEGFSQKLVGSIEELVQQAFGDTGRFSLLGRSDVSALISVERQRELMGCVDDSRCITEIAGALGTDYVALADVSRFGTTVVCSIKVLETRTGKVSARVRRKVAADEALAEAVDAAAAEAAEKTLGPRAEGAHRSESPEKQAVPATAAAVAPTRPPPPASLTEGVPSTATAPTVPGPAAQVPANAPIAPAAPESPRAERRRLWTWVALAGAGLALAGSGYFGWKMRSEAQALGAGPVTEPAAKIEQARSDQTTTNTLLGVACGLGTGAVVLFVLKL